MTHTPILGEGAVDATLKRIEYDDINENPYTVYKWLREHAPIAFLKI